VPNGIVERVLSVVFRKLATSDERSRARRLLDAGGCAYRSPRLSGDETWFGLCDLTAADGDAPEIAAAALRRSPRVLEVCAMVVPTSAAALRGRLVRELTDVGRADGAQWMAAGTTGTEAVDLLRREGFAPVTARDLGLPALGPIAWWALEM
jgi:hypothetical protein